MDSCGDHGYFDHLGDGAGGAGGGGEGGGVGGFVPVWQQQLHRGVSNGGGGGEGDEDELVFGDDGDSGDGDGDGDDGDGDGDASFASAMDVVVGGDDGDGGGDSDGGDGGRGHSNHTPLSRLPVDGATRIHFFKTMGKFLGDVMKRMEQFKDELQAACIDLVLSVPSVLVDPPRHIIILRAALRLGRSHLPTAEVAVAALDRWLGESRMRSQIIPFLPSVLPLLGDIFFWFY
jgi:hypothetical protein